MKIPTTKCPFCHSNLHKNGKFIFCNNCGDRETGLWKYDLTLDQDNNVKIYSIFIAPFEITNYIKSNYTEIYDWSKTNADEIITVGLTNWNLSSEEEMRKKINLILLLL